MSKTFSKAAVLAAFSLISTSVSAGVAISQTTAPAVPEDSVRASSDSSAKAAETAQKLAPVRISGARSRYIAARTRTATKTSALPRDVPQSLITITEGLVRDQAMQGLADVVRYIPGASMGQGEGNRDQPTLRGNSSTADFFVDGVRDDVQYFRDLYNVERVEALKGSNAMVFGRGGGGGILNRVTKEAQWLTRRDLSVEGGAYGKARITSDLQQMISAFAAGRLNAVYESSGSYRDGVRIERSGFNPVFTLSDTSRRTRVSASYEHFNDDRTADRGIPSFAGKPVATGISTFFGNADESGSKASVDAASLTAAHEAGTVQVRNHSRFADYDKNYQNVYPGAVTSSGTDVSITAYRHATQRRNLFNQTDVTWTTRTGQISHEILAGAEFGRQTTGSFRETGYFEGTAASVLVPVSQPRANAPLTFRQSVTDADAETTASTSSMYVQDQISLSKHVRLLGGARYERFGVRYEDKRTSTHLQRTDDMVSPRIGVVIKPGELLSVYASYSVSFLPGSGDQFSSLTDITTALRPERFTNYEAGAKWDAFDRLALSAALYRLDRRNTRAVNPQDPTMLVQTGAQRSQGFEISAAGNLATWWEISAAAARQSAKITSATTASAAGASVPLVPASSVSLWNRYSRSGGEGFAVGAVYQSRMFAGIDNKVTLPSFMRIDAALFSPVVWGLRGQLNIENAFNVRYYPTAHSNNNITPGSPRAARLTITAQF